jgi:hypothetical protein
MVAIALHAAALCVIVDRERIPKYRIVLDERYGCKPRLRYTLLNKISQ